MAFERLSTTGRYTCEAADAKPTTGIATGSTCYETDTGDLYIFDGAAWVIKINNMVLTGSMVAQDLAGDDYIRVVDAAPFAYDSTADVLKVIEASKDASAYESVTVAGVAIGFTVLTYGSNRFAFITCETAQIRFRVDGISPTASEGHLLNPGDMLKLNSNEDITAFKAIRTGSTSGVLKVTFSEVA